MECKGEKTIQEQYKNLREETREVVLKGKYPDIFKQLEKLYQEIEYLRVELDSSQDKYNKLLVESVKKNEFQEKEIEQLNRYVQQLNEDFKVYDKVHIAYEMMKNLLIEMNGFGDLEGYDTKDIFELIGELETDN